MQNGDIATWESHRIVVVLEGVLAKPRYKGTLLRQKLMSVDNWEWEVIPIKHVVDNSVRLNVSVEVVTFMGQQVADQAADWLERYGIPVAEVLSVDFETFCQSLTWRLSEISRVIDSDPDRLMRYGQLGYSITFGEGF